MATATETDTGLTATITPTSATSKILVMVDQNGCFKSANATTYITLKLYRGASEIAKPATSAAYNNAAQVNEIGSISIGYLDSPATTSATTYKTMATRVGGAGDIAVQTNSARSTITLFEIGA